MRTARVIAACDDVAGAEAEHRYHTTQDDLRNAGATWVDQEVVVDANLVTSRQPSDIPAFNREMLNLFAAARSGSGN
jgi:protease I